MSQLVKVGDFQNGTIYSISRATGYKVSDIIAANPGIDIRDLTAETVIELPAQEITTSIVNIDEYGSIYSISRKTGIPVDDIIKANPNIDIHTIPSGAKIKLPSLGTTNQTIMKTVNIDGYGTIYQVHRQTGVPVDEIVKANPNLDINNIPPHTDINVPTQSIPKHPAVDYPQPPNPTQEQYNNNVEKQRDVDVGNDPKSECECKKKPPKIIKKFLTPNKYSRPQKELRKIKAIVIHWVANPNSKAISNRNFFESRKSGKKGYGSAHFIIGLQGEIIQCLPESEQAYHVGAKHYTSFALKNLSTHPNNCTIGIELTHINWDGEFKSKTLDSAKCLTAKLLKKYGLSKNNIIRHYDVTKKDCPRYYVKHPNKFERFKNDVEKILSNL